MWPFNKPEPVIKYVNVEVVKYIPLNTVGMFIIQGPTRGDHFGYSEEPYPTIPSGLFQTCKEAFKHCPKDCSVVKIEVAPLGNGKYATVYFGTTYTAHPY